MMSNNSFSICDYRKLNFSKLEYSIPKTIQGGNKSSFVYYRESHNKVNVLYIRIPKLITTTGFSKKNNGYFIDLELDLNNEHSDFYDFLNKIDQNNTSITFQNSVEWFGSQLPQESIDEYYISSVKLNSGGKNPSLKLKIPMRGNTIIPQIYNNNTIVDHSYVSPQDQVECIISLSEVRFSSEKFYPIWNLIQLKINKKIQQTPLHNLLYEESNEINDNDNDDQELIRYKETKLKQEQDRLRQERSLQEEEMRLRLEEKERLREEETRLRLKQERLRLEEQERLRLEEEERLRLEEEEQYRLEEEERLRLEEEEQYRLRLEDEEQYRLEEEERLRLEEEEEEERRRLEEEENRIDNEEIKSIYEEEILDVDILDDVLDLQDDNEDKIIDMKYEKIKDILRLEKEQLLKKLEAEQEEKNKIQHLLDKQRLENEKFQKKKKDHDEKESLKRKLEEERLEKIKLQKELDDEILEKDKIRKFIEEEEKRIEEERLIDEERMRKRLEEERILKEALEKERIKQEKIKKLKEIKKEARRIKEEINITGDDSSSDNEEEENNKKKYYIIDPEYSDLINNTNDFEEVNL